MKIEGVRHTSDVNPVLVVITPAAGFIKEEIIAAATQAGISLLHAEVQANRLNHRVIRVGPAEAKNQVARGIPFLSIFRNNYGRPAGLNI